MGTRFKTRGTFQTEAIIEIAQRMVAQIQDAGIEHVTGLNFYVTPADQAGRHRRFVRDGLEVDLINLETWDLEVPETDSELSSVYDNEPANGKNASPHLGRRATPSNSSRRTRRNIQT